MFQLFNTLQRMFYEFAHGIYEFAKEILFDEEEQPPVHYRANVRRLQADLRRAKVELKAEKTKTSKLSSALQLKDNKYKKQQEYTDTNLASIVSKLLLLEGELKREKREIDETIEVKDKTIVLQAERILRLERVNMQMRQEMTRLKKMCEGSITRDNLDNTIKSFGPCTLDALNEETIC
ncbi:uncharacterized protein LOC114518852 [Dendronephthya gigantea]|uniref:uncharacterized protein LOC114518852 n=1 Tax=Dendronephthya gigantea TaxID=151771 RepID=UPI00106AB71C|nr:uncharacterized protein LOC114518852 [Dendronephthya gigantea]